MANCVTFGCTTLANLDKRGVIGIDAKGRYEIVIGGLDVYNSVGELYVRKEAEDLFADSSAFQRRVRRGVLRGEYGHPRKEPGMKERDYLRRMLSIHEEKGCVIHHEIDLDFERVKDKQGKPVIAIISRLSPSGPYGDAVKKSLDREGENVCFSIRAFTDDYDEGRVTKRILRTIVTFDYVNEPGIEFAEKFMSPACESDRSAEMYDHVQHRFSRADVEDVLEESKSTAGIGVESQTLLTASELFGAMGWGVRKSDIPGFMNWGR